MKFLTILAVAVAVSFSLVAADYNTIKIADKEFLLKQKKIYNLLYYISQPSLVNPSLYEEGRSYNIEANIDSYTNTVNHCFSRLHQWLSYIYKMSIKNCFHSYISKKIQTYEKLHVHFEEQLYPSNPLKRVAPRNDTNMYFVIFHNFVTVSEM